MIENREIMARNIRKYMERDNVKATDICKALNIKQNTFSDWINAKTYPRIDAIERLATYFNISKADLVEENDDAYYLHNETAKIAQAIYDNKNLRVLFDAARDSKPEDLKMVADMLQRFKETNPDG